MAPTLRPHARRVLVALVFVATTACLHRKPVTPVGLTLIAGAPPPPLATLVWVGTGEAERYVEGAWRRIPAFDYEFSVEQRRYPDHWESTKVLRRRHPDYDGSAGPRVQVYLFRIGLAGDATGEITYAVTSTLGPGRGRGDHEFRDAVLEIDAKVSRFAPFDRYRITQHYDYARGELSELVELSDGDAPWVRNHEQATMFGAPAPAVPST